MMSTIFTALLMKAKVKLSSPKGISLIGGLGIGLVFIFDSLLGFIIFRNLSEFPIGLIVPAVIILVFGLIDDYRELSIKAKFLVQIAATALLISSGIRTHIVYLGEFLNIIITFIWVLGITNAFNHLDVMDGVAGTIAIVISLGLIIVSIFTYDIKTIILCSALIGSVLGFQIYNFPPARIYMGNSGSHFLGFVLAASAIVISYAPLERKVALISPLLILGFPVFDTLFLIFTRLHKKKIPFKKSNDHLVLRFLALGHSKKKALSTMLICNLFFVVCGILVTVVPNILGVLIIMVVVMASLVITKKMVKVSVDG
ncbi:MAG: MraY family glycosyltransferase [Candidatus Omnitrophota bacterium]